MPLQSGLWMIPSVVFPTLKARSWMAWAEWIAANNSYIYIYISYVGTSALSSGAPTGRATNKNNLKQINNNNKSLESPIFFSYCFLLFFIFLFFLYVSDFFLFFLIVFYLFIFYFIFLYVFLVVFTCNYVFLCFLFFLIVPFFCFRIFFFSYFATFAGPAQIVTYQIVTSSS